MKWQTRIAKSAFIMLVYLWASPWTSLGLALGSVACLTGGRGTRHGRTVEFHGGWLVWLLSCAPIAGGAAAITLGHTVLGRTPCDLERCRAHERVHVRQYERWGPFFLPAYFGWSVRLWLQGRNAYLDNPFEIEAYESTCDGKESK